MAGVISRSAYLEAKTPAEGEEKGKERNLRQKLGQNSETEVLCCMARWEPDNQ